MSAMSTTQEVQSLQTYQNSSISKNIPDSKSCFGAGIRLIEARNTLETLKASKNYADKIRDCVRSVDTKRIMEGLRGTKITPTARISWSRSDSLLNPFLRIFARMCMKSLLQKIFAVCRKRWLILLIKSICL
eukprot:c13202_g1_i1.p1 GENE.c13202_g1_i1~~c13202_g1_i1.p1  ORF type:complete len:132 (-),score=10.90 c13202_g1_i1:686-1081(-)